MGQNPVSSASSTYLDPRHEGLARRTSEIDWRCPTCDFINLSGRLTCNQCRVAIPGDGYAAMHGGSLAGYDRLRPPVGAGVICRDSAFDWRCPSCRQQNCSGRWHCDWCDAKCPPIGYVELLSVRPLAPPPVRVIDYTEPAAAPAAMAPAPAREETPLPELFRKTGTWQETLELVQNRGCPDADACASLFARLGRTRPDSRALVRGDARFAKALDALTKQAATLSSDQLGDVVTGLGKLGCGKKDHGAAKTQYQTQRLREEACLLKVSEACVDKCPSAGSGDVVNIIFGFAIVGHASSELVKAVVAAATQEDDFLGVRETANVLWSLETLGHGPSSVEAGSLFRKALPVLSDAPSKLTERYAGRALWAYRGAKTPSLFDRVCGKCVNDVAHWTPSAVALLIRAVADAGVAQDKVADACSKHVTDRREAYGASSLVDAAWGLACYGGREDAVTAALESLDYACVGRRDSEGDGLARGGLATLGRTFAACLAPPLSGADAFARSIAQECHTLSPDDLVVVTESFAALLARKVSNGPTGMVLVSGDGKPWSGGGADVSLALTNAAVSLKGDCDGATLLRLRGALESAGCASLLPQDFVSGAPTAPALDEALALFNEARASKLAAAPPVPSPAVPSGDEPAAKRARVDDLDAGAVKKLTVQKLRAALTARGLDATGLKAALQDRLLGAIVG